MTYSRSFDRRSFIKTLGLGTIAAIMPFGCDRMHTLGPRDDSYSRGVGPSGITPPPKDFTAAFGIIPAMITPMHADRSVDYDGLKHVVDWHIGKGVSAIFLASGSGEYWYLNDDEIAAMASTIVAHVGGDIPVLCGSTNHEQFSWNEFHGHINAYRTNPQESSLIGSEHLFDQTVANNIALSERIAATGVDGIFVTAPRAIPYERFEDWTAADWMYAFDHRGSAPDDERVIRFFADLDDINVEYFTEIHDQVSCEVWGYEIPGNTAGYKYSPSAFARLGELERTIGMKDTTISIDAIKAKVAAANGTFQVLDANVENLYRTLRNGASGAINTTSNVAPGLFVRLHDLLFKENDPAVARNVHRAIMTVDDYLMDKAGYPLNAKYALIEMGVPIEAYSRSTSFNVDLQRVRDMVDYIELAEATYPPPDSTGILA